MGETNTCKILVGKPLAKQQLEKLRIRHEVDIKMNLQEICCVNGSWHSADIWK
jgi:hypothetical protein